MGPTDLSRGTMHVDLPRWVATACVVLLLGGCRGADRAEAAEEGRLPADGKLKPKAVAFKLPHITVNREKGYVDVDAKVCLREGMLELIVTTVGGKEHEACFAILAKPRHVMVGLLVIGLKPGSPGRFVGRGGDYWQVNPSGDPVTVSVIYKKDGKQIERPISDFVFNERTKKPLGRSDFVFSGSRVVKADGKAHFAADIDGTVLSLVSFGSELMAYPIAASDSNELIEWVVHSKVMPEEATSVVIRLRPGKRTAKREQDENVRKGDAERPPRPAGEIDEEGP